MTYLSQLENGRKRIKHTLLPKIARALDTTPADIIFQVLQERDAEYKTASGIIEFLQAKALVDQMFDILLSDITTKPGK